MVKLIVVSFALFMLGATTVAGAQSSAETVEYKQRLVDRSSATEGDLATVEVPRELATSPQQCYLQLELCLDHCDGDINCNRLCVRQYHKCLGH
jgi:hypothetical protein